MQVNSALYYYDYSHVHTPAASPSALGGVSTSTFAVPGAEMIGFDTDVLWLMTDRITLGATVSFTHSEYTEDFDVIDEFNAQRPGSLFDPLATPFNIKGNQMLRVPETKFDAYAQYALPMGGDRGTLTFLADYSWIDKVYFSLFEEGTDKAPSYSRVDTRVTWLSSQRELERIGVLQQRVRRHRYPSGRSAVGGRQLPPYRYADESADLWTGSGVQVRRLQIVAN